MSNSRFLVMSSLVKALLPHRCATSRAVDPLEVALASNARPALAPDQSDGAACVNI